LAGSFGSTSTDRLQKGTIVSIARNELTASWNDPKREYGWLGEFSAKQSCDHLPSVVSYPSMSHTTDLKRIPVIPLNYFVPYYINEQQSNVRGIKCGWYILDECGRLGSGPFSSPDECLETAPAPMSMWSH
jgi:hypothetical protein